jgi:hypothetical protein
MVFVLSNRLMPDAGICIEYCRVLGYHMCGIVKDDWTIAMDYLHAGQADVVVVADDRSLDPDRAPRVEVVAHLNTEPTRPDVPTGRRTPNASPTEFRHVRTARINRRGAGA